jgi:hypothetical protein
MRKVGIVALSLAVSSAMQDGTHWDIPADMHPPIEAGRNRSEER